MCEDQLKRTNLNWGVTDHDSNEATYMAKRECNASEKKREGESQRGNERAGQKEPSKPTVEHTNDIKSIQHETTKSKQLNATRLVFFLNFSQS